MKAMLQKDFRDIFWNEVFIPSIALLYLLLISFGVFLMDAEDYVTPLRNLTVYLLITATSFFPQLLFAIGLSDARYGWIKFILGAGGRRKDFVKEKLVYSSLFILPVALLTLIPVAVAASKLSQFVPSYPSWTLYLVWIDVYLLSYGVGFLVLTYPMFLSINTANLVNVATLFGELILLMIPLFSPFFIPLLLEVPSSLTPIASGTALGGLAIGLAIFALGFLVMSHLYRKKDF